VFLDEALAEAEQRGMMNSHRGRTMYAAGLAAAREAVAALDWSCDERQLDLPIVGRDDALAAIDALRGAE
jgi:hypothetical protein